MRKLVVGIFVACLILSALHYQPVRAADLYVDDTGTNSGNCQNSGSPCRTIQYAINQAIAGDTIHIAAGTYRHSTNGEVFPITINKNLTLVGAGAASTEINGYTPPSNPKDVIQVGNTTSSIVNISGLRIEGGRYVGLRFFNGSSGIVTLNYITDNGREGIRLEGSSPTIIDNNIYTNDYDGIHALSGSNPRITNNYITGNERHGIYVENSNPIINGNLIEDNGAEDGGEDGGGDGINIYGSSSSPIITNNTIIYNYDDNIDNGYGGNPTIANNIIAFTIEDEGIQWWYDDYLSPTGLSISEKKDDEVTKEPDEIQTKKLTVFADGEYHIFNNDVYGNACDDWMDMDDLTGINGNISEDPLFVSDDDAHLQACDSPAINAGSNSAPQIPDTDLDGNTRIVCIVDMGAYEVQASANCPCQVQPLAKRPTTLPSLLPAAQNHISQSNDLLKQANDLLTQAQQKGANCTECEKLINEAKALLDKSKASLTNPIYANNLALQALEKLKQAIDCLKALLG